jgi:hypothetical protein
VSPEFTQGDPLATGPEGGPPTVIPTEVGIQSCNGVVIRASSGEPHRSQSSLSYQKGHRCGSLRSPASLSRLNQEATLVWLDFSVRRGLCGEYVPLRAVRPIFLGFGLWNRYRGHTAPQASSPGPLMWSSTTERNSESSGWRVIVRAMYRAVRGMDEAYRREPRTEI